ncbi:MAG: hypothetical protein ACR2LK_09425 [Solirubrobacteraceae bacterium]
MRTHAKFALLGATLLIVLSAPLALGAGEGNPLDGGTRNPTNNESLEYNRETEIIANTASYGTRQSNKSNNGGGAIYGCRSGPGGTPAKNEPCVRANNLKKGLAFEFQTLGTTGGTITALPAGDGSKPFTTNATGVATGLNADRVDGKNAAEIATEAAVAVQAANPIALVAPDGTLSSARGVVENGVSRSATGDYDVKFAGDLEKCALNATVTGAQSGQVTVTPAVAPDKKTTTVDVRTFDGVAGTPADRGFHLHATC